MPSISNNKKIILRVLPHLLASCLIFMMVPLLVHADPANGTQASKTGSFIPCNGYENVADGGVPCDFNQAIVLINNIVEFMFKVVMIPVAIIAVIRAGWLLITDGKTPGTRTKAKNMLFYVVLGVIISLAAYLIVKTILKTMGYVAPAGLDFINLN